MPQRKSAKEELKKNIKRRQRNLRIKGQMKLSLKKIKKTIESKDYAASQKALKNVFSMLDKSVSQKIIHANKAAREKSRLSKKFNSLKPKKASPKEFPE